MISAGAKGDPLAELLVILSEPARARGRAALAPPSASAEAPPSASLAPSAAAAALLAPRHARSRSLHPHHYAAPGERSSEPWARACAEARALVLQLMSTRGARLAAEESRPPLVHWVVLALTGSGQ